MVEFQGQTTLDDYSIIKVIGQGSFGKVFQARLKGTPLMVALKFMTKIRRTPAELDGLRQEIDIMRSLRHPCIISLLDAFETEQDIVFVLEYALSDLREIVDYDKCLTEEALAPVASQLIHALHFLHSCHIIHRDIKPSNVLLKENGAVCYADFGFARSMGASTVALVSMKGTPLYMSPECIHGRPYDFRSDLWSLGALLFELAVGHPPFTAQNIVELSQRVARDPVRFPPTMSPSLRSLLAGLLVKDPAGRLDWRTLIQHPFIQAAASPPPLEDVGWFEAVCAARSAGRPRSDASMLVASSPRNIVTPELLATSHQLKPERILSDVAAAISSGATDPQAAIVPALPVLDFASRSPAIASASLRVAEAACSTQGKVQLLNVAVPRSLLSRIASQLSRGDLQHFLASAPAATVAAASAVPQAGIERVFTALAPALSMSPQAPDYRPVLFDCACLAAAAAAFRAGGSAPGHAIRQLAALRAVATARSPAALLLLAVLFNADVSGTLARAVPLQSIGQAFTATVASLSPQSWWISPVRIGAAPPTFRPVLACTGQAAYVAAGAMFIHAAASAPEASVALAESMWPALVQLVLTLPRPVDPSLPAFGLVAAAARALFTAEVSMRKVNEGSGTVLSPTLSSRVSNPPTVLASDQLCGLLAELLARGCYLQPSPDPDAVVAAGQALWLARAARVARGESAPLDALTVAVEAAADTLPSLQPRLAAVVVTVICRVLLAHMPVVQPYLSRLLAPPAVRAMLSSELPPEALADGLVLIAHVGRVCKDVAPLLSSFPADALLDVLTLSAPSDSFHEPQTPDAQDLRARLRSKCANAVGNLLRHSPAALPALESSGVLSALVPLLNLNETPECARWAAFALGNAAFHSGESVAFPAAVAPLCKLLSHQDRAVRLNATGSVSNMLRHSRKLHPAFAACNVSASLIGLLKDAVQAPDVATAAALALCSVVSSTVLRPTVTDDLVSVVQEATAVAPLNSQLSKALGRLNERL